MLFETPPPARPGVKRRTGTGHLDSYGDGRVCSSSGCETILSRYNGESVCWRHDKAASRTGSIRGVKLA